MAVKWIGEAAKELGLSTLDAVELLAARGEYPFNGFLDEDRVFLLKRAVLENRGVDASGGLHRPVVPLGPPAPPLAPPPAAQAPPSPSPYATAHPPAPPEPASRYGPGEKTSVTAALPTGRLTATPPPPPPPKPKRDGADERTMIIPPPADES